MEIGPGLQTPDSPGLYGELISGVLERADVAYELRVYPLRRTFRAFFRGDADCVWGLDSRMLRQFNEDQRPLLDSEPLFTSTQHVFMAPDTPALGSLSDLAGKRVGLQYHSNLRTALEQVSAEIVTVTDNDTKVRILVNRRVEAVVGWIPDLLVAFRNVGADPVWINPVLKVTEADVGIACHESDTTRKFLEKANAAITEFAGSPAYYGILDKYGAMLPNTADE